MSTKKKKSDAVLKPLSLDKVKLNGGLLGRLNRLVCEKVLDYQWRLLNDDVPDAEPSHAMENLRIAAGRKKGEFRGMVFQDSDIAKWLEAASYKLTLEEDPELEAHIDEVIALIEEAQEEDGYFNTYFTIKEPDKKWSNLAECHELYCAGHLIEAAVAYYQATGKRKLLNIVGRFADLIDSKFGVEPGKLKGYPGHQEIELALVKLYRVTGEDKYLKLASYFIDERGNNPHYFDIEWEKRNKESHWPGFRKLGKDYYQAHLPVREQKQATGHAVRAMYMYCGMTDVALETGDDSLIKACKRLWENVTNKQMYITGGIGSSAHGESFTFDYDLPNDRAYTETCAAIGLVFWAHRMLHLDVDRKYADVMERALYNGVLSGVSLDGKRFFYVNPLEVWPEAAQNREDMRHVKTTRQKWFGCACCPPNLARLLASIGQYAYSQDGASIYIHLFSDSKSVFNFHGKEIEVIQETNYPWLGYVKIKVKPEESTRFNLAVRIPAWCNDVNLKVNGMIINIKENQHKGYVFIERMWEKGDQIELMLAMPVERIYPHSQLRENAGKVALQRGPIVYCLEEIDNGSNLSAITLPVALELQAEYRKDMLEGVTVIKGRAYRTRVKSDSLYTTEKPKKEPGEILAVPYFAWDNRKAGEMTVWIREG